MRTAKELLIELAAERWRVHTGKHVASDNRKIVHFVLTDQIKVAEKQCGDMASSLHEEIEYAASNFGAGPSPMEVSLDPSACTVHFTSNLQAKTAAHFLADIISFWSGNSTGTGNIDAYYKAGKSIHCEISHVCSFFDPNGFMDFNFTNHPSGVVITIDKAQQQFAKQYLDAFSKVLDHGIVADWPYKNSVCELIWTNYQARADLIRRILSTCSDRKPHPERQIEAVAISFKKDEDGLEIMVNGEMPRKFKVAKRAILALALQDDLNVVNTRKLCHAYDPGWKKSHGTKNVAKKFSQAMQSLQKALPSLQTESLGSEKARVLGIIFTSKTSEDLLQKQIRNLAPVIKDIDD